MLFPHAWCSRPKLAILLPLIITIIIKHFNQNPQGLILFLIQYSRVHSSRSWISWQDSTLRRAGSIHEVLKIVYTSVAVLLTILPS